MYLPGQKCPLGNCTIQVTVTACASTGISLQYPTVGVVSGETNVPIEWSINSNQYEFADNGIVIKNDPNRVFINGGASPNKKMFTWTDRNPAGDKTDYKYTVTVKPKNSTTPCPSYDPIIVNDY